MSLNWNEIKNRARGFAAEFADAAYEKGETQTFYNAFFEVFGVKRRVVARYEERIKLLSGNRGFIDLFWPGMLLVEQKSAGRNLVDAAAQADAYFDALKDKDKPRYRLVSDFQNFELLDRDTGEYAAFRLADLPNHVEKFGFIIGREKRTFKDQDPVNIQASEIMGGVHDALEASGFKGHDLEVFLVRLLFMLFADDTGIFQPRDHFLDVLESRTAEDGSDTGLWLARIFDILNKAENARNANLDEDLNRFPYVNGELFAERIETADFAAAMRNQLIEAARFNWAKVSPAIFGSLFQSVMDAKERRKKGAHYTTETNIMKVIGPLFLDDLRAEFDRLKALRTGKAARLEAFRRRLGTLTFLDPACGCGNFLIIAYRELRQLEIEVLEVLRSEGQLDLIPESLSNVDVDQFYGIELEEFPARIAEVAMWMIDHIMNVKMAVTFGIIPPRIPLKKSPHILNADALATDWNTLLAAEKCSYVFGNPPFLGAKYQTDGQRQQVREIARLGGSGGTLDFVCAWFLKAGAYVNAENCRAEIAFVSTNSITQGEQVAQLWPILFDRCKLEIAFAHRTFEWNSEARGKAHVHCVIVGLTRRDMEREVKRLFSYASIKGEPEETRHKVLSPYLFDAGLLGNRHLVVKEESLAINGLPKLVIGSKPIDGGHMIFTRQERDDVVETYPESTDWLRPYVGAQEYLNGGDRWILAVQGVSPEKLRAVPPVFERIRDVKRFRLGEIPSRGKDEESKKSPGISSSALAKTPTEFHVTVLPKQPFLLLPRVSSERRDYAAIGWLTPPAIPSDATTVLIGASVVHFAILTSAIHMAWLRSMGGRLKSDYRYSIGLVYNTFPWPVMSAADEARIGALGRAVLDARANHPGATLADLYDPDLMPPDLRRAHTALDKAVDRLYRKEGFASERERVEHLFMLYERLVAPIEAAAKAKARKPRRPKANNADA